MTVALCTHNISINATSADEMLVITLIAFSGTITPAFGIWTLHVHSGK